MSAESSKIDPVEMSGLGPAEGDSEFLQLDEISKSQGHAVRTSSSSSALPDRPTWFKGKLRQKKSRGSSLPRQDGAERSKRSKPQLKIAIAPEEVEELSWKQRVLIWIVSITASAYAMSLLLHTVLIGVFSLIVASNMSENEGFSTVITDSETIDTQFDDLLDTELSLSGSDAEITQSPQLQALPTPNTPSMTVDLEAQLAAIAGAGNGTDEGNGGGFVFKMPSSGRVVTKGSFTAWTEPQDPEPGRDYIIVIQIKLPSKVRRYRVSDLSGLVVGTDKYRQVIPWDSRKPYSSMTTRKGKLVPVRSREYLPLVGRQAQLMIKIPGAERLVKDTIQIRSKILKEKQTLEIEF